MPSLSETLARFEQAIPSWKLIEDHINPGDVVLLSKPGFDFP